MASLVAVVAFALAFGVTTGFQDGANALAASVATRAARPRTAVVLAALGCAVGPLILSGAVARTIAGIVRVPNGDVLAVLGAALTAALAWNVVTWRLGLPSSASHALVGGLAGAALAADGGRAVQWGGFAGARPVGVLGVLAALALAPALGAAAGAALDRLVRRGLRRATVAVAAPVRAAERLGTFLLGAGLGANDGAKVVGLMALALLATGHDRSLDAPLWVAGAAGLALALGAITGGWPIAATLGRRVVRMRSSDGLATQVASIGVAVTSTALAAPVSTTQVVASSVVGAAVARGRARHVSWPVVGEIVVAWVTTLPVCAAVAAVALVGWRWVT